MLSKYQAKVPWECKSKNTKTWNFSSWVLFHHHFYDFDKFYQNFMLEFLGYVNQNTWKHEISAIKYFFTIILVILASFIIISCWILGTCKSKYMRTWHFSFSVLLDTYFSDFDKFYQNFLLGFQQYVNQNTKLYEFPALKYFFTIILVILTSFIKISPWDFSDL